MHVGRNVYHVTLPQDATRADLEYFILARVEGGWFCPMDPQVRQEGPGKCPICGMPFSALREDVVWPATAPVMNQTVVVVEK